MADAGNEGCTEVTPTGATSMATSRSEKSVSASAPQLTLERVAPESLRVRIAGTWRVGEATPPVAGVRREIDDNRPQRLLFEASELVAWDSALVSFVVRVTSIARAAGVVVDRSGLPARVQRLVALTEAPPMRPAAPAQRPQLVVAGVGTYVLEVRDRLLEAVRWIGEVTIALVGLLRGRVKLRRTELLLQTHRAGIGALVSVMLVVGVLGLILANVALFELTKLGATSLLARIVAVGVVRELAPLMTAIVVAVRTGAAYASDLDSMRRHYEIDAFTALGISPVEVVALPRILAVTLMMPLLCAFAIAVGLLGGSVVAIDAGHIPPHVYLEKTLEAVSHQDVINGLLKSMLYGFVIGVTACHLGLARRPGGTTGNAAISGAMQCVVFVILTRGLIVVLT